MKHPAGQATQRLGSVTIFFAWAPERSPAPFPRRAAQAFAMTGPLPKLSGSPRSY